MTATAPPMDLHQVCEAVAAADAVQPVGSRTHWEVGNPPGPGVEVRAPDGVIAYDPAELTITLGAGTTVAQLGAVLAEAGQECPLDPRSPDATVGGTLATGLSGRRRLRHGPLRDRLLEARFVTADGRLVKGGGPTVKNVTGYDLPRLLVGSLGTIGVLVQVTLRCQPRPECSEWAGTDTDPFVVRSRCFRPSCVAWDGDATRVLLEGHPGDVVDECERGGLDRGAAEPRWPDARHRGRISVRPDQVRGLGRDLAAVPGLGWLAEVGVGTVHVASNDTAGITAAREAADARGGWLLREAGCDGMDGFGRPLPNLAIMERIRSAFDPTGKLAPGRVPRGSPRPPSPAEGSGGPNALDI